MPGDESARRDPAHDAPGTPNGTARWSAGRWLRGTAGRWLSIFAVSLGLFIVRFLVPAPVGQADNRDGPRLMCGLGVAPVTHGHARFFRYAYFEYARSKACAGRLPYPSSELVPLELARLLTPVLRLPGTLNLIAAGPAPTVAAGWGLTGSGRGRRERRWCWPRSSR